MAEDLDVVTKTYDLILWLLPQVAKFPRSHRFTLGDRLESLILDILEQLIEAHYRSKKLTLLYDTNIKLERLRFMIRLARDLEMLGMRRYVLKGDIRKYFPSIDHQILYDLFARKIRDEDTLWLIRTIIDSSNPQEPVNEYFPGDDLFTPPVVSRCTGWLSVCLASVPGLLSAQRRQAGHFS